LLFSGGMKPVLILYATREGHTLRIADHIADSLRSRHLLVRQHDVGGAKMRIDFDEYAAVVVAASVHGGRHEREMLAFVKEHRADLERIPAAFLSVSLSEAGAEDPAASPEHRAKASQDVRGMIDAFLDETRWHPARVQPVAGALTYSEYGMLLRLVMKRIARQSGGSTDTSRDHVYTDWVALDRFVDEFLARAFERAAEAPAGRAAEAPAERAAEAPAASAT
jgi:menaquinone-dependent protoporphyrinogen oxidase